MTKRISLSQGAGGELMDNLIKEKILNHFNYKSKKIEVPLSMLDDAAVVDDIVFSTDSHTVQPIIFPGGDLGSLAVSGTINDVAVMGAKPIALSSGFIIEEGLSADTFEIIVKSMSTYSKKSKVPKVTGDKNGVIWIGTWGSGLNMFDPNTEKFYQYKHNSCNPKSIRYDIVMSLFTDRSGNLWKGTWGGGLNKHIVPKSNNHNYLRFHL